MYGFICGYHDLNVCYYERSMVNLSKTKTVQIIKFYDMKMVVTIFAVVSAFFW